MKRGLFILENILGTPPPPPPPDIPPLEEARQGARDGRTPTLREALELHREPTRCAAPATTGWTRSAWPWRTSTPWADAATTSATQPIDAAGTLVTGEAFDERPRAEADPGDDHRRDFYRCLTEKLLTYALGRGLEYHDVEAVDRLVDRLESTGGRRLRP